MTMDPASILKAYFEAGERGDWTTFADSLSEDFVFTAVPITQSKREIVSSTKALWAAFPDLKFNIRIQEVQGEVVKATYQITGTHSGTLVPPVMGQFVTVAPTGKKIMLPVAGVELTVRNGKIVRQANEPKAESSWPGILEQLGVKIEQ